MYLEILIGTEFAFEPEIWILQEDAGVEEAREADGKLVKRGPNVGSNVGAGKELYQS